MAVASLSLLLSLAGTSLVLISGEQSPPTPALAVRIPSIDTPQPVDPTVTVRTVSAVDLFEGVGTASGDLIRVRVTSIRSTAPCWQAESLEFARDALLDKNVRLVVSKSGRAPDGRLSAQVRLPGGQDFARTALTAGAALAGTAGVDPELLAAETDARTNRRGLWTNACAPSQEPSSQPPSASSASATTTSPAPQPGTTSVPTSVPNIPVTTTTTTPPSDDIQYGVQAGKPCSPEGALGITEKDREVTCRRTLARGLRWSAR